MDGHGREWQYWSPLEWNEADWTGSIGWEPIGAEWIDSGSAVSEWDGKDRIGADWTGSIGLERDDRQEFEGDER